MKKLIYFFLFLVISALLVFLIKNTSDQVALENSTKIEHPEKSEGALLLLKPVRVFYSEKNTNLKEMMDVVEDVAGDKPTMAYLQNVLQSRNSELKKCLKNLTTRKMGVNGTVEVQLHLRPTGKVKSTNIIQTDIKDKTFLNCVLQVLERTKFKEFKGEDIIVSLPLEFT